MSRMEASRRNASALSVRFSKSLASRRQRLSHAQGALDHPAHRQHLEAFGLVGSSSERSVRMVAAIAFAMMCAL